MREKEDCSSCKDRWEVRVGNVRFIINYASKTGKHMSLMEARHNYARDLCKFLRLFLRFSSCVRPGSFINSTMSRTSGASRAVPSGPYENAIDSCLQLIETIDTLLPFRMKMCGWDSSNFKTLPSWTFSLSL